MEEREKPFRLVAAAKPIEAITTPEGTTLVVKTDAISPEKAQKARDITGAIYGVKVEEIGTSSNRKSFGGGTVWNSPWNPTGPKKVNLPSSQNPELN